MSNLKGSKTEENLLTAFAGESMARNKYTFYASQAKKEGYTGIRSTFVCCRLMTFRKNCRSLRNHRLAALRAPSRLTLKGTRLQSVFSF